ncbi:hypothetical protein M407DRAFT_22904 [Tulasnella calospora MUT 4182]|uniref:OPT oligopeptide transporter n=1 Tax=Tulasnella calospora MUT 4182 TaxID=1051891 RepID=A0A0C3L291_9AGAM|nr:hypothetical protein M407DRAFT_22904 [Tulasnella calospora MUT 4182]
MDTSPPQYSTVDLQTPAAAKIIPAGIQSKLQGDSPALLPDHRIHEMDTKPSMEAASRPLRSSESFLGQQSQRPHSSHPPGPPPTSTSASTSVTTVDPIASSSKGDPHLGVAGPSNVQLPVLPLPVHAAHSPTDDDASSDWGYSNSTDFTRSAAPSPSIHTESRSDANSLRSRRSKPKSQSNRQYDNDDYVHDHLNDPNYTYRKSVDDVKQDTSHVRWDGVDEKAYPPEAPYPEGEYYEGDQYDDYWEDDSPYPEVRAAVANTDDPTMPTNTFRMWFLGIIFTIFIAAMNQFFYLRSALVAQLIALPAGKLLERILPTRQWTAFGYTWSFNPGPWNIKEHTLVTVMANVVSGGAYATDIIAAQRTFYDQHWSVTYQLSLVISTQLLGFAFAGVCRRFLVWPASMIWPETLVNAALFNTMHSMYLDDEMDEFYAQQEEQEKIAAGEIPPPPSGFFARILARVNIFNKSQQSAAAIRRRKANSRFRLFNRTLLIATVWNFFPSYLFTALSQFTPLCWIFTTPKGVTAPAPALPDAMLKNGTSTSSISNGITKMMVRQIVDGGVGTAGTILQTTPKKNIIINQLFGYSTGLGMGFITFDWSMISYVGSPLVTPWWAEVNVFATLLVVFWIIAPALYYSNVFYSQYLPMSSTGSYDNRGQEYNSRRVVQDGVFQPDLYKAYSPLYISITFALSYALSFGALTATFVHTWLWYRHDIKRQFRASLKDASQEDIHARLMLAYPEVPQWWYATIGIAAFLLGCITIQVWDTKLPFWAYVLSIAIAVVYLVPIGMIQAITNMQVGLNVITELIVGYALPGRPVAMMIFKTFGYITMAQALSFVSDLKLGHYMKIPPRMMFLSQTVAALIASFVVVGVQGWMFENIPDLCTSDQKDKFTCPGVRVFSTASLIWGGIGPARAFNQGSLYYPTLFFFIIGAVLPIPFYYLAKRFPRGWYKYINIPVAFTGIGNLPPASGINYSSWTLVGFIFQYWIRRHHFRWWSRYNYIFSAALDAGVAIGTIIVFFTLVYPKRGTIALSWWGNTVNRNTPDTLGTPLRVPAPGEFFGIREWS